uniref:Uncharacterized protein n=1 Tax=Anguilla anguilla TaxID=7936 RepID=A0A0E9Q0C5_ANGAN
MALPATPAALTPLSLAHHPSWHYQTYGLKINVQPDTARALWPANVPLMTKQNIGRSTFAIITLNHPAITLSNTSLNFSPWTIQSKSPTLASHTGITYSVYNIKNK